MSEKSISTKKGNKKKKKKLFLYMIGFVICVSVVVISGCKIKNFFFFLKIGPVWTMALYKVHNCWTRPDGAGLEPK